MNVHNGPFRPSELTTRNSFKHSQYTEFNNSESKVYTNDETIITDRCILISKQFKKCFWDTAWHVQKKLSKEWLDISGAK